MPVSTSNRALDTVQISKHRLLVDADVSCAFDTRNVTKVNASTERD